MPPGDQPWVVLGGGGLKGLGHIGAWRAIGERGLEPAGVVGTSIGALVGVCLGGGMEWKELEELALDLEREDIVRVRRRAVWINGVKSSSLYQGEALREYLESILPVEDWSQLRFPVQVNAVDLGTGQTEWFGTGARTDVSPLDAVLASASLPVLYPPVEVQGRFLVDGGVGDALPLDRAAELGASGILAVDVGSTRIADAPATVERGMVAIHQRVFSLMAGRRRRATVERWTDPPLVYIRPRLAGYSGFEFDSVSYFLDEGYRAASEALAESLEARDEDARTREIPGRAQGEAR
ncbi:MAG: patatin-like phospholipase family protein [Longimicrobiales bacterium]|nr:patatin-like phospholipase family protein [Longimicrobiales bacterium]